MHPFHDHLAQTDCQQSRLTQLAKSFQAYMCYKMHTSTFARRFWKQWFYKTLLSTARVFSEGNHKKRYDSFPKIKEEIYVKYNIYLFTLRKQERATHSKAGVGRQIKNNVNQQNTSIINRGILHRNFRSDSSLYKSSPSQF